MYFIYSVLLGLGLALMLPKFLIDARRHGKYIAGLRERLGLLEGTAKEDRPVVWLHCVSVGETQAARPLLEAIRKEFPHYRIVVSTVTATGQQLAREVFKGQADKIFYFPLDWRWTVGRALRAIAPSVVLIMETELWPNFLWECHSRQIPVAIVNGRLSEQSFRRYQLLPSFVSRVVDCLNLAIMQTDTDATRIRALGLDSNRILVSGNLKFDAKATDNQPFAVELARRFKLERGQVILAASTHEPEEKIILEAFASLLSNSELRPRLIIAPRHPERFSAVTSLLVESGRRWTARSAPPADDDSKSEIILLDTIGELRFLFPLAAVVFVGGSLVPVGGHNILEPAAAGACIVTGPHTENFREITETFRSANAIIQLPATADGQASRTIASVFENLLHDQSQRELLGRQAKALVEANRGATGRTLEFLKTILTEDGEINGSNVSSTHRSAHSG